jgi:hypothetical protein
MFARMIAMSGSTPQRQTKPGQIFKGISQPLTEKQNANSEQPSPNDTTAPTQMLFTPTKPLRPKMKPPSTHSSNMDTAISADHATMSQLTNAIGKLTSQLTPRTTRSFCSKAASTATTRPTTATTCLTATTATTTMTKMHWYGTMESNRRDPGS